MIFNEEKILSEYLEIYDMLDKRYPEFIRKADNIGENIACGALFSQVSINPMGEIKLCTMDTKEYFSFDFGNVLHQSIKEIYDNNKEFLYEFIDMEFPNAFEVCKECENALYCHRCYLRGMIQAKKLKGRCKWFEKYKHDIINEKFNIL